jgi:hypothetical protein
VTAGQTLDLQAEREVDLPVLKGIQAVVFAIRDGLIEI